MLIYSFDVFDTLISRRFADYQGVFATVRENIKRNSEFPDYFVDEFANLRIWAEKDAHKKSNDSEITLDEIYIALSELFPDICKESLMKLKKLEVQIEIENCYPIPENVSKVMQLLEAGHKVILISDMYLPKDVVKKMLECAEPQLSSLTLYISSEIKTRKSDGRLFDFVCSDQNIRPSSLIHTGDNFIGDHVVALKKGIKSVLYKDSSLSEIEKSYFHNDSNLFLQLVAGASKQSRLTGYNLKPSYRLGASFTGPMFYGFVFDLIKKAVEAGTKHIYFLARDGYLFKLIADEIVDCFKFDVVTHYLYVSRQAVYFASIFRFTPYCFKWVFQELDNFITFRRVAKRLNFEVDGLLSYLDSNLKKAITKHGFDDRLSGHLIESLKDNFLNNVKLKLKIEAEAKNYREIVIGFFEQEGLLKHEKIAFVDIGWHGTLQDTIYRILKSKKPKVNLTSYYFAVTNFSYLTSPVNRKVPAYLFPSSRHIYGPMFEVLLQCDHGTTIKYQKNNNGEIVPILKEPPKHIEEWGVKDYKNGISSFSKNLSSLLLKYPEIEFTFFAIAPILIEKLEDAAPEVVSILGDTHYSGDIEEANLRKIAPPVTALEAFHYFFSKKAIKSHWIKASYSRSKTFPKFLLDLNPRRVMLNIIKYFVTREQLVNKKHEIIRNIVVQKARIFSKYPKN